MRDQFQAVATSYPHLRKHVRVDNRQEVQSGARASVDVVAKTKLHDIAGNRTSAVHLEPSLLVHVVID
jgi:hypothetical protein